jgi:flagellum-specific peptidoglycan hydrolase FlgJ
MTMVEVNDIKQRAIELWQSDHIILPSVTAAQFILESASGNSVLVKEANNYFGIKASAPWTGDTYKKTSVEVIDGQISNPVSAFRKYASWQ